MEKRRFSRYLVSIEAELIASNTHYRVEIENISEYGASLRTIPSKNPIGFPAGARVGLRLQLPTGDIIQLSCEIRWLRIDSTITNDFTSSMGVELIDPPMKLKDFVKSCS